MLKIWNHLSFVNISPTLVNDTSIERSSRVLQHGNPNFFFKSLKFEFRLMTKGWNHLSFVNVTPTMVIDTSMERSLRVLQHWNLKSLFFFQKVRNWRNWILSVPREKKSPWLRRYLSYIGNWYINGKFFTSTTALKPKNLIFFKKVRNSNFDLCRRAEITLASSISVLH